MESVYYTAAQLAARGSGDIPKELTSPLRYLGKRILRFVIPAHPLIGFIKEKFGREVFPASFIMFGG